MPVTDESKFKTVYAEMYLYPRADDRSRLIKFIEYDAYAELLSRVYELEALQAGVPVAQLMHLRDPRAVRAARWSRFKQSLRQMWFRLRGY